MQTSEMKHLKEDGWTLEQIGVLAHMTREGVRQRLSKAYGTTYLCLLLTTDQLAEQCNLSPQAILVFCKRNGIKQVNPPSDKPRGLKWWSSETVSTILALRVCCICGAPLPKGRNSCCSDECLKTSAANSHKRASWRHFRNKMGVNNNIPSLAYKR